MPLVSVGLDEFATSSSYDVHPVTATPASYLQICLAGMLKVNNEESLEQT